VEDLRHREPPLDLTRTQAEVRRLRPSLRTDPQTGESQLIYVRDYVVNDIVTTNLRSKHERPIFFAVTIPRENMADYFPYLQMEGLAYRLTRERGPENLPKTAGERLLNNFFGIYDLDALLTGADAPRQKLFAQMAGVSSDAPDSRLELEETPEAINYPAIIDMMGENRTDVFRNRNTRFLLGNYPVALVRAGYQLREEAVAALQADAADTVTYDTKISQALASFELAATMEPDNDLVAEAYPILLLEHRRDDDALRYLERIAGRIPPDVEARVVNNTMIALAQVGRPRLAAEWADAQIQKYPDRKLYYEALFRLMHFMGQRERAAAVIDRWEAQSGQRDQAMEQALQSLRPRRELENTLPPAAGDSSAQEGP
jgi:hypothetical protein